MAPPFFSFISKYVPLHYYYLFLPGVLDSYQPSLYTYFYFTILWRFRHPGYLTSKTKPFLNSFILLHFPLISSIVSLSYY